MHGERVKEIKKTIHFGHIMLKQTNRYLKKLECRLAEGSGEADVQEQLVEQIQHLREGHNTLLLELLSAEKLVLPYFLASNA